MPVHFFRLLYVTSTASAFLLSPAPSPKAPLNRVQRSSSVVAQYQQYGYAQPETPAVEVQWPWEQRFDENGHVYYANHETHETSWDPPPAAQGQDRYAQEQYANNYAQQPQYGRSMDMTQQQQDHLGRNWEGQLDFEQYRQFMRERGERLTDRQLRVKFDELNNYAQSYDGGDLYARVEAENDQYGNELLYNGGRNQYANAPSYQGGAYNYRAQQTREMTPLLEFLRWQDWYVKYCKLRNINVPNRG